jgi:hypothetical protein
MRYGFLVLGGLALLAGCSGSTGPAGTGRLTFQLAGRSATAAAPSFAVGADVLTITGVQVVARKIRLERGPGNCPADNPATGAQSASGGEEHGEHEHDDCPDVRLGPMLLEPPIDAGATAEFSVDLPEGTYEELKIQIHKPSDAGADATFLSEHPEFADISIRVTGTFNGTAFTFVSPLTAEVEIELETPVVVSADAPVAVTLAIDVGSWFAGSEGGLLNPIDPTQQVRSRIEQNIRRSFHAFEDHDRDGHSD